MKKIFFDFEGVITNTPMLLHKNFFDIIKNRIDYETLNNRYQKAKIGAINYKDFMSGFENYEKDLFSCFGLRENVVETLEYFCSKKIDLFLASNHIDFLSRKEVELLKVGKYFKKMFFSNELGVAKPSKEFFEKIKSVTNKDDELFFVDDAKRNLLTAKEIGFITIFFPNNILEDKRNDVDFQADYTINNIIDLKKIIKD
jgi:HAD superfamily hydrolase (TIGR01549 family)